MFSLTGRTLRGVGVFPSHTAVGSSPALFPGVGEMRAESWFLFGGPPPTGERLLLLLLGFPGSLLLPREALRPGAG